MSKSPDSQVKKGVSELTKNLIKVLILYIYFLTQRAINLLSLLTEPGIKIKKIDQCAQIHHNIKEKFYQNVLQAIHLDYDNLPFIFNELLNIQLTLSTNNKKNINKKSWANAETKVIESVKDVISNYEAFIQETSEKFNKTKQKDLEVIHKKILAEYQDPTSQLKIMIESLNNLLDTCENSISNFYNNRVNKLLLSTSFGSLAIAILSIIMSIVTLVL